MCADAGATALMALRNAGITVDLDGGKVIISPIEAITPAGLKLFQTNQRDILGALVAERRRAERLTTAIDACRPWLPSSMQDIPGELLAAFWRASIVQAGVDEVRKIIALRPLADEAQRIVAEENEQ